MSRWWFSVLIVSTLGCAAEPKDQISELVAALSNPDAEQRYIALQALGDLGPAAAPAALALAGALKDPDPGVRAGATFALAKIGPEANAAIPGLMGALQDRDKEVRYGAAYALPAMGKQAESALAALRQTAQRDTDPEVRKEAAKALRIIDVAVKHQHVTTTLEPVAPAAEPAPPPAARRSKKKF